MVGLLLAGAVAFFWLRSTDVFDIRVVAVVGADHVTQGQIAALTSGVMGESLLSASTDAIEEALLALPYVEAAHVHRGFPNSLEIELVESRPVARLRTDTGGIWLVSDSGRVLEDADAAGVLDLPVLVLERSLSVSPGQRLPAVVTDMLPLAASLQSGDIQARLPGLEEIAISAAGYAALLLEGGGEVRLGSADGIEGKLAVALDIVEQCLAAGKVIEYVDASVVGRIAVKAK